MVGSLAYTKLEKAENGEEGFSLEFSQMDAEAGRGVIDNSSHANANAMSEEFSVSNGIQFGDSFETVIEKEPLNLFENTSKEGTIYLQTENAEILSIPNSYISYYFDEKDRLNKIEMSYESEEITKDQLLNDYEQIQTDLEMTYGDCLSSTSGDKEFLDNDELICYKVHMAVSAGNLISMIEGIEPNMEDSYSQWQIEDADGTIIIEHYYAYIKNRDVDGETIMHKVYYYSL